MALAREVILELLAKSFPNATVDLEDYAGDSNHYELKIIDSSFTGLSKIQQHKLVYKALGEYVGNELHAIALQTYDK
jgi:stress-induced morphogen